MKSGVCSITFRSLRREEFVALVEQTKLDTIEWGGDVHVPPGDLHAARNARELTLDAGLEVCSYGSYYVPVDGDGNAQAYQPVLETTAEIGAKTVRIWAGHKGPDEVTAEGYGALIDQTLEMADAADRMGIKIAFEFHVNTLTATNESTVALLRDINHSNIYSYWQPPYWEKSRVYRLNGLKMIGDRLLNLHVFQWGFDPGKPGADAVDRRPLAEGVDEWKTYFNEAVGRAEVALLEFARNDDVTQFLEDARTLTNVMAALRLQSFEQYRKGGRVSC